MILANGGPWRTDRVAGVLLLAAFALLALALIGRGTARATFAGENGMIAFARDNTIRAVNPDGSDETFLTCDLEVMAQNPGADPEDTLGTGGPVWSPDGRRIAFRREIAGGGPAAGEFALRFVLNPDGSENQIGGGRRHPAWSPDGERIAIVSGGEYDMWGDDSPVVLAVANRDGSDWTTLAIGGDQPAWSPDGERIAFAMRDPEAFDGPTDIWTVRPDGTEAVNLTEGEASESGPAWSPDGERIAFERRGDIWVMNADGSGQNLLAERGAGPAWSPDGRRITFGVEQEGHFGRSDIWVMNADGSELRRLAEGASHTGWSPHAVWSPDGRQLAFGRDGEVWVMNADGSEATPVARGGSPDWQPIPPGTDANPGPSQFCFPALRRNTDRGIARLVVEVSGPGRVILHQQPAVRRFAGAHREAGPGRVVVPIRPRGGTKRTLERRAAARLPVSVQVTYRPLAGEPRTRSGRIWLVKAPRRCRDVNNERVRVIRIEGKLGCKRIRRLAAATVYRTGHLDTRRFFCDWQERDPAFPKVRVKGRTYTKGYCREERSGLKASFLGLRKRTDVWGRTFTSTAVTEDGKPRRLVPGTRIRVRFLPWDPSEGRGRVEWSAGCNNFAAPSVRLTSRRLRVSGPIWGHSAGCAEDRQRQNEWLRDFFASDPRWRLRDRRLVLRSAGIVIRLRDARA